MVCGLSQNYADVHSGTSTEDLLAELRTQQALWTLIGSDQIDKHPYQSIGWHNNMNNLFKAGAQAALTSLQST